MATKRMNTYIVTLRWKYNGELREKRMTEKGITPISAKNKAIKCFGTAYKRDVRMSQPTVRSVISWDRYGL